MEISRRKFLGFLAPLAVLPVVGPHMLLSERPRIVGWKPDPHLEPEKPVYWYEIKLNPAGTYEKTGRYACLGDLHKLARIGERGLRFPYAAVRDTPYGFIMGT